MYSKAVHRRALLSSITCASSSSSAFLFTCFPHRIRKNTTQIPWHTCIYTHTFARALFADRQHRREEVNLGRGGTDVEKKTLIMIKRETRKWREREQKRNSARVATRVIPSQKLCVSATRFWAAAAAATTLTSFEPSLHKLGAKLAAVEAANCQFQEADE